MKKDYLNDIVSFIRENPLLFFTGCFFLFLSIYFRWYALNIRALEYDEIYTVSNFVPLSFSRIFTEVATPNNHMLHTFFVKLFHCPDSAYFTMSVRLCAAIAGTLTVFLFLPFRQCFKNIYTLLFAMFLFAFNGAHIHYSQTARGYTLLTFFLLLTLFSLWAYQKNMEEKGERKKSYFFAFLYFISVCSSSVSISIGVLFAFSISFAFLLFHIPRKIFTKEYSIILKKYLPLFLAFTAAGIFILAYYLPNMTQFAKGGKDFGMSINSLKELWQFFYNTFYENDLFYPLLLACAGLFFPGKQRKMLLFLLSASFLMILITLLTSFGPPRVYLPLLAFLLPSGGMGAGEIFSFLQEKGKKYFEEQKGNTKLLSFLLFFLLLLPAYFSGDHVQEKLTPYDMNLLYNTLDFQEYSHVMPVFTPTDSVSLKALFDKEAAGKILNRLPHFSALLFTGGIKNIICTKKEDKSSSFMLLPEITTPFAHLTFRRKKLPCIGVRNVEKPYRKNEIIFLSVFLMDKNDVPEIKILEEYKCFHLLNFLQTLDDAPKLAGLFAAKAEEVPFSPEEMLALEERTQGRIRFRILQK